MDAFYFGGTLIGKRSLRTALLYYDSVIHYDVKRFFRQFYEVDRQLSRVVDEFYDDTQLLRQNGALRLLDLESWVSRYGQAFELLPILYQDPGTMDPMVYRLVHSSQAPRLVVLYSYGKGTRWALPNTPCDFYKRRKSARWGRWGQEAYYSETDAYSLKPHRRRRVWKNRFVTMSVAREVAYGLLGGIEFDAVPMTDFHTYEVFLQDMLYTLFCWGWDQYPKWFPRNSRLDEGELRDVLKAVGASGEANALVEAYLRRGTYGRRAIIEEIVALELPSFENLPDEELLEIRERCRDSLQAFREEIKTLEKLVSAEARFAPPKRDAMIKEIRELVSHKVSPKVSELTKAMSEEANRIRRKRVANLIATATTLTGYAFVPFGLLLLPILAVYGKIASDELNHLLDRLAARKDSMYFLLQVKQAVRNTYVGASL